MNESTRSLISAVDDTALRVVGPAHLGGTVDIQGSKNVAQKVLPSTARWPNEYLLRNVPEIEDVEVQIDVLRHLGAKVNRDSANLSIDTRTLEPIPIPAELSQRGTGTFMFAGALLGRFGEADIAPPGGDRIGFRPIDFHLDVFEQLGATIERTATTCRMRSTRLPRDAVAFQGRSVNGTVNALLAIPDSSEPVTLRGAASEPDIAYAIDFAAAASGWRIHQRHSEIDIAPRSQRPTSVEWTIPPDRNDTATFALIAALLAHDEVELHNPCLAGMDALWQTLEALGTPVRVRSINEGTPQVSIRRHVEPSSAHEFEGKSGNGFSTDWGPLLVTLLLGCAGKYIYTDTVFTNRFGYTPGLVAMGANLELEFSDDPPGWASTDAYRRTREIRACRFESPQQLRGAIVEANDVRGGAALAMAGLAASGETVIVDSYQIRRGYSNFPERLRALGADAQYVPRAEVGAPVTALRD